MKKRHSWKRKLVAGVCAVALAAGMTGCSASDTQGEESAANSSTAANDAAATPATKELHAGSTTYFYAESMDPAADWDSWYLCYYGIAETLFKVSDDLTAEPWLAESIEGDDGQHWTLKIREGVTFSNGEPVDAAAVKAAWERTYTENSRGAETLAIDEMTADGQTLSLVTSEKVPGIENILCDPLLCVYYVGDGIDYANDTPCTGPYKKVEFVAEDHIVMEPNETYWDGARRSSIA